MRVKSAESEGHAGIGDLSVDFTMGTGRAPRTVVLIGSNGSGKTTLLEAIFQAVGAPRSSD